MGSRPAAKDIVGSHGYQRNGHNPPAKANPPLTNLAAIAGRYRDHLSALFSCFGVPSLATSDS